MAFWLPNMSGSNGDFGIRNFAHSLGNLCRHFDIPLESHHRALCDAEAAAGLLALINERRMAA